MDTRVVYTSYATTGTPYVQILQEGLVPSLQKFNLPYEIELKDNRHSWILNTQYKAEVLYDVLMEVQGPTVMLDGDAEIVQYPTLFCDLYNKCDIAFHNLDTYLFWHNRAGMEKREPLTGTIYVNYNEQVLSFLNTWIETCLANPDKHDMACFGIALSKHPDLKIYQLPLSYVAIVNKRGVPMPSIENPVIIQHQKSRLYRRLK